MTEVSSLFIGKKNTLWKMIGLTNREIKENGLNSS